MLLLAACASVGEVECRKADWYDLGFRDAIFGLQRQEGFYEHECAAAADSVARFSSPS